MPWYAIEEIEEAVNRTKGFLLPFNWKLWAKIAVIALFAASFNFPLGVGDAFSSETEDDTIQEYDGSFEDIGPTLGISQTAVVIAAIAFAGVALLFGVISKVFQFIYYQTLLDDEIKIVSDFSKHLWSGFKLFWFEIFSLMAFMASLVLLIGIIFINPFLAILTIVLGLPVFLVGLVFFQFTNEFIPLLIIENDQGILASWSQMLDYIKDEWKQLGIFVIVRFFLGIANQIIFGTMALLSALLVAIPVGVVAFLAYLAVPVLGVVIGAVGIIVWILSLVYFVNAPLATFFRYYSILVYDDFTQAEEKGEGGR